MARASNSNGLSLHGTVLTDNAPSLVSVPETPTLAPVRNAQTNNNQIAMTVFEVNNNGSPITNISVEYSTDNTTWNLLETTTDTTKRVFVYSPFGIDINTTYYFRYRVSNSIGYSGYSPVGSLTAQASPE